MEWIETDDVRSGDIIETISRIPDHSPICKGWMLPIVKHYGIVVNVDGRKCLAHNIIGRSPTIMPLEQVFVGRRIERVLRTGMCDADILKKFNSCRHIRYSVWFFNCETLMNYIWGRSIGFPQQYGYAIGAAVLIVVIMVLIFSRKRNS